MSERITVRAGQKWRITKDNVTVSITILDMYASNPVNDFAIFYKVRHERGGEVTETLFIDLHKDLDGWELVEE